MREFLVVMIVSTFVCSVANADIRHGYDYEMEGFPDGNPEVGFVDKDRNLIGPPTRSRAEIERGIRETWPGRNPGGKMPDYPDDGAGSSREPLPLNPAQPKPHIPLPENHPLREGKGATWPETWYYTPRDRRQRRMILNNLPPLPNSQEPTGRSIPQPPMPHSPAMMP